MTHARIAHAGNWESPSVITASTTDADFFADGPDNSLTYEKWKPTALPADWEADYGANVTVDYCVIGAHTLGTDGCNIKVQKWDGVSAWVDIIGTTAISTDEPIMAIFAPVTIDELRVRVTSGTSNPEIGVIKFGSFLQMARPIYGGHSPMNMGRQTTMRQNISETGEWLGRTKQRTSLRGSFAWQHLSATWVRANWPLFQKSIETEPFFIAWRPDTFDDVSLCWSDATPIPTNMGVKDLMAVTLNATGYGYD